MQNATRFLLDESHAGVGRDDAPAVFRLRQHFPRPVEPDVAAAVRREMAPILANVEAGQPPIAVTGSSRGIANLALVVRTCVSALRRIGGRPLRGARPWAATAARPPKDRSASSTTPTASPRRSVGCRVESSMEVVQIGTTGSGFPVYQDRRCHDADGVLAVNRVKPHTGFTERVESGICKMLVIGMGKQAGASKIHTRPCASAWGGWCWRRPAIIVESARPRLVGRHRAGGERVQGDGGRQGLPVGSCDALIEAEEALLQHAYTLFPAPALRRSRRTHRRRDRQERERFGHGLPTSSERRPG